MMLHLSLINRLDLRIILGPSVSFPLLVLVSQYEIDCLVRYSEWMSLAHQ